MAILKNRKFNSLSFFGIEENSIWKPTIAFENGYSFRVRDVILLFLWKKQLWKHRRVLHFENNPHIKQEKNSVFNDKQNAILFFDRECLSHSVQTLRKCTLGAWACVNALSDTSTYLIVHPQGIFLREISSVDHSVALS